MKKKKEKEVFESNIYHVSFSDCDVPRLQVYAEFFEIDENQIAKFYDENSVMIAAMREWESIEKEGSGSVEARFTDHVEIKRRDLPENWGKVNGEKF